MSHRWAGPAALLVTLSLLVASCRSSPPPAWLAERTRQEVELAARSPVAHDFRFSDQRQASGITFQNRIVDDAGRTYKLAHYDHGSGVGAPGGEGGRPSRLFFRARPGT